ncbi:hypothetical protein D3C73_1320300 [compost metagenome]
MPLDLFHRSRPLGVLSLDQQDGADVIRFVKRGLSQLVATGHCATHRRLPLPHVLLEHDRKLDHVGHLQFEGADADQNIALASFRCGGQFHHNLRT